MAFYSFVAFAKDFTGLEDPLILVGPGRNVFTAHTDNLEELLAKLAEAGVDVRQVNNLTDHEDVPLLEIFHETEH